jgi:cell division septal protein FtsQ
MSSRPQPTGRKRSPQTASGAQVKTPIARARRRKAQRRTLRRAGLGLFCGAFLAGAAATTLDLSLWELIPRDASRPLRSIAVLGHQHLSADEVATQSGLVAGTPLPDLDLATATERLLDHPWIREVRFQRLANDLLVLVEERRPAALLRITPNGKWRAIEADGTPFADVAPSSLPGLLRLHANPGIETGAAQPRLAEALRLTRRLEAHGIPRPETVTLPSDAEPDLGWRCRLPDGGPEVLLGLQPSDRQLARLAELLAAKPQAVRSADRIDMRFRDRAILRVAQSSLDAEHANARPARADLHDARGRSRPASG